MFFLYRGNKPRPLVAMFFLLFFLTNHDSLKIYKGTFLPSYMEISPVVSDKKIYKVFYIDI